MTLSPPSDWSTPEAPLALTLGDPAGVGPIIALDAWQVLRESGPAFVLISPPEVIDATVRRLKTSVPIEQVASAAIARHTFPRALPILAAGLRPLTAATPGQPDPAHAPTITGSIEAAVTLTLNGKTSGVVTNPIAKSVLYAAGFPFPGHTEFLADLCARQGVSARPPVMMLVGGGLRVALATIHQPLMSVAASLTTDHLMTTALTVNDDLKSRFGLPSPRLVFTGLNPHAGESGTIGREEVDTINPAAAALRDAGIDIADARPADTVFAEALSGRFDAVIAMTHDQGLIPVKTLDLWGGVNTTLGLPIIRTSPDHGTAFDAAASGRARADSLIAAIRLAGEMAARSTSLQRPAHA